MNTQKEDQRNRTELFFFEDKKALAERKCNRLYTSNINIQTFIQAVSQSN